MLFDKQEWQVWMLYSRIKGRVYDMGQLVGVMIFMLFGAMISGGKVRKGGGSTRKARKVARGGYRRF
jgi:hypothetical protein